VVTQAVSRRLPTAAAWVRSQVKSCGICGEQSGIGAGFFRVLRFPLPILIPPNAPYSSTIRGWYNRPVSGRHTKWTQLTPPQETKTNYGGNSEGTILWDVTPYNLVEVYQHFRGTYYLHLQDQEVSLLDLLFDLMMEAVCSSRTLVHFYQIIRHHIPEGSLFSSIPGSNLKWDLTVLTGVYINFFSTSGKTLGSFT
jgi:hypothetical protein